MSRLLEGGTKVLSGPNGSFLQALGAKIGIPDLQDSLKIVDGGIRRQSALDLQKDYLRAGADVATTNTFWARTLLHEGRLEEYREVVKAQVGVTREALQGTHGKNLVIPLGPFGVNGRGCYDIAEAPTDENEARDFHEQQFGVVRDLFKRGSFDAIMVETISTAREALGVVLAAQKLGLPIIPSLFVMADGNLKTGEKLADVLRHIDSVTGNYSVGYSVNCCPLAGVEAAIHDSNGKRDRIIMAYPNASDADPSTLEEVKGAVCVRDHHTTAAQLVGMTIRNESLKIVGGCCGFDPEAIATIKRAIRTLR